MISLLNKARALGFNIYQESDNHYQWTIEIPLEEGELLIREELLGKWLLISNKVPQVWLKTEQSLEFLKNFQNN